MIFKPTQSIINEKLIPNYYSTKYANNRLIRFNKFILRFTDEICNLFFYWYEKPYEPPNITCDVTPIKQVSFYPNNKYVHIDVVFT